MFYQILLIATGLVLFLYGLVKLGTEMQKIFSVRIRQYIKYLVKNPLIGIVIGTILTAIFQSSSATTVLVVGMVSAGLISFFNSLGLILGAGIGTAISVQLVALKITTIAPVFIVLGVLLWFIVKGRHKSIVEAIFYFGLLFFGLSLISQGFAPFKDSPTFLSLIQETENPFLGILVGFIFTAITQSSLATIGILVLLGQQHLITIAGAIPIILGVNIGTSVPTILASIGASKNAKRTAFSHLFFKLLGVIVVLPFLPWFISLIKLSTANLAQQIVTGNFLLCLIIVCIFIFLLKPFSSLVTKIIPGEERVLPLWPEWLDKRFLYDAQKSFGAVTKELDREMMLAQRNYDEAVKLIDKFNKSSKRSIFYIDLIIDNLQKEIMHYLDRVSQLQLSKKDTMRLFAYSSMVDDIERIGDHVTNLVHLAEYKSMWKVGFSKDAEEEISAVVKLVAENISDARFLLTKQSKEKIRAVTEREKLVDITIKQAREDHLNRFYRGVCLAMAGPIYNDMLVNFERISDHCQNIAEYVEQMLK